MSLADSAIRLRRTKWGDRADLLSEELYTMFLQEKDATPGQVTLNIGDGTPASLIPQELVLGNFALNLPDLTFPDFVLPQTPQFTPDPPPNDDGQPQRFQREKTTPKHLTGMFPGRIVSQGSGGTHSVKIFPYGTTGQATVGSFTEDPVIGAEVTEDATELNGVGVSVGTYVTVFRHVLLNITTTEMVERRASGDEVVVSTKTSIEVVQTNNEFVSGGNSVFAGKITGGSGTSYSVDVYLGGTGSTPTSATVTQLDIDSSETIPANTWALIVRQGNGSYVMQVPVILNDE